MLLREEDGFVLCLVLLPFLLQLQAQCFSLLHHFCLTLAHTLHLLSHLLELPFDVGDAGCSCRELLYPRTSLRQLLLFLPEHISPLG